MKVTTKLVEALEVALQDAKKRKDNLRVWNSSGAKIEAVRAQHAFLTQILAEAKEELDQVKEEIKFELCDYTDGMMLWEVEEATGLSKSEAKGLLLNLGHTSKRVSAQGKQNVRYNLKLK